VKGYLISIPKKYPIDLLDNSRNVSIIETIPSRHVVFLPGKRILISFCEIIFLPAPFPGVAFCEAIAFRASKPYDQLVPEGMSDNAAETETGAKGYKETGCGIRRRACLCTLSVR
jgi:hypothetical protein